VHAVSGRPGAAYADVSRIRYCRAKHFSRHYEHMRAALERGNIIDALASFELGAWHSFIIYVVDIFAFAAILKLFIA
jgi:hypothetical protein